MKPLRTILVALVLCLIHTTLHAEGIDYFFTEGQTFDPKIPTPEEFLGYPIGSRISEHSRINAYFEKLNESPIEQQPCWRLGKRMKIGNCMYW